MRADLAELPALDCLPTGLFQGPVLVRQALSLAQKLIAARIIRVNGLPLTLETQPDGDFLLPRITIHYCHFLDAYYESGTLHTWYLFNSHRGHTKKLFLLVDETERSASGTCSESHTLQLQDRHSNLDSASLRRTLFPDTRRLQAPCGDRASEGCLISGPRLISGLRLISGP